MTAQAGEEHSADGLQKLAGELAAGDVGSGVLAVGWATVDLERSAAELPHVPFDFAPDDEALGARALIGHPGRIALLLLEPSTEGRLAGTLARNGEGIAVLYQQSRGMPEEGALKMTPLGRLGRLTDPGRRWGPFLIVID